MSPLIYLILLSILIKHISFIDAYCEPPWQPMNGHCYKHVTTPADWFTANSACQNEQSSLTTLSSLGEAYDVYNMVYNNGGCCIWIGYHDNYVEGQWVWVDPTGQTSFEDWIGGAPAYYDTSRNCALSDCFLNNFWMDEECSDAYGYVCEKDQLPLSTSTSEHETTVSVGANRATTDLKVTTQPVATTTMEIHFLPPTTLLPEINYEDAQRQVFRSALAQLYEVMREEEGSTQNFSNYLIFKFKTRSFSRCIMECRYLSNCTAVQIHQNECSLLQEPGLDMTNMIYLVYKLA